MTEENKPTCGTCRYFVKGRIVTQGECWRYPPTVITVAQGIASKPPSVQKSYCCGEHDPPSPLASGTFK